MISKKILIAHPQSGFADLCKSWLEETGYEAEIVSEREQGMAIIEQEAFDLLLVSNALPDVGGLEFLRILKERGWLVPAILFSKQNILPVRIVSKAIKLNVVDIIGQPQKPTALLKSVRSAIEHRPTGEMHGNLREFGLSSLISIICNEGRQASLQIWNDGRYAKIFFDRGDIVHAVLDDDRKGKDAVHEALTWHEGHFALEIGRSAPERSIHEGWTGVVLEGLQRIDEENFDQEQLHDIAPMPQPKQLTKLELSDEHTPAPLGRSPTFDLDEEAQEEVERQLEKLYSDLLPRCILFTRRGGRLLHLQGEIKHSKARSLAALVAGSFSADGEIAEIVAREGEARQFRQSLQEGEDFDLYSAQVGKKWILAVAFDPVQIPLGLARQYALRAAKDLTEIVSQAAETSDKDLQEVTGAMDDQFRQGVGDALEDLFV